jgi:hypothetical protein
MKNQEFTKIESVMNAADANLIVICGTIIIIAFMYFFYRFFND